MGNFKSRLIDTVDHIEYITYEFPDHFPEGFFSVSDEELPVITDTNLVNPIPDSILIGKPLTKPFITSIPKTHIPLSVPRLQLLDKKKPRYAIDACTVLTDKDGTQIATYYWAPKEPKYYLTILYSHNGKSNMLKSINFFINNISPALEANVFFYDYSGYGKSKGTCSALKMRQNIEMCYLHLQQEHCLDNSQIILWGDEMGTGPTMHLASLHKGFLGIILRKPLIKFCLEPVESRELNKDQDLFNFYSDGKYITDPTYINGKHRYTNSVKNAIGAKEIYTSRKQEEVDEWIDFVDYYSGIGVGEAEWF